MPGRGRPAGRPGAGGRVLGAAKDLRLTVRPGSVVTLTGPPVAAQPRWPSAGPGQARTVTVPSHGPTGPGGGPGPRPCWPGHAVTAAASQPDASQ